MIMRLIRLKINRAFEYYKIVGNIIFVHAGFDDYAVNPFEDKQSMIWESKSFYRNPMLSGKTIIHGHRPNMISNLRKQIEEKASVISIDTGCVYDKEIGYGILTALEVNTMTLYSFRKL